MSNKGAIVITGSSTGIGAACAVGLVNRGYTVFAGLRKMEDAEHLKEKCAGDLRPIILDVIDQGSIDAARDQVTDELKGQPLVGLFNNAGASLNGPIEFVDLEDLRWQFEVNVVGQVAVTQAFLPQLRESEGRIITTGSVGGFV